MRKSAWDRRLDIVDLIVKWHDSCAKAGRLTEDDGMTMRHVAKWLHMSPSTHLMERIRECVEMGFLIEQRPLWKSSRFRSRFFITEAGKAWLLAMTQFEEYFA